MKTITLKNCKSREDIESVILSSLEYENVVKDSAEARAWFSEAAIDGDVHSNDVVNEVVSVWDGELSAEELYRVIVTEYYVDSGSNDYVYSYDIHSL